MQSRKTKKRELQPFSIERMAGFPKLTFEPTALSQNGSKDEKEGTATFFD